MQTNQTPVIAVIGGGFCGMMTAVHLIKKTDKPVKIIIVNSGYPFGKGIAYSAHTYAYLLNVRAVNMSAFPKQSLHFIEWLRTQKEYENVAENILPNVYMPRKRYSEYLASVWNSAMAEKPDFIDVEMMNDYAEDIFKEKSSYQIHLKNGESFNADIVVLATGNSQPNQNVVGNKTLLQNEKYFGNPWNQNSVSDVKDLKDILIIGSGLTMIDTVLGLIENGFKGTVHSVSPHGFSLLPHKYNLMVYDKILKELPEQFSLYDILSLTHRHAKSLAAIGIGAHLVTDALRPYSHKIWQSFSLRERKIFLKKVDHIWNSFRHRIPLHIFEMIQQMRIDKKLITHKGIIADAEENDNGKVKIVLSNKEDHTSETIIVERIINCTGPQSNITKCSNQLLNSLFEKKMIVPDELFLGVSVDEVTGAVINAEGRTDETMFTLGGNLKGVLWESIAVPELRVQAENLADHIISMISNTNAGKPLEKLPEGFIE